MTRRSILQIRCLVQIPPIDLNLVFLVGVGGIVPCPSHMVRDLEPTVFSYMAVHRACTHAGKRHESFDMLERMALARKTDPARRKELADHVSSAESYFGPPLERC